MSADDKLAEIRAHLLQRLDSMEQRPGMWAGDPEALELQYLTVLEVLALIEGVDFKGVDKLYETLRPSPSNLPLCSYYSDSHDDKVAMLKVMSPLKDYILNRRSSSVASSEEGSDR